MMSAVRLHIENLARPGIGPVSLDLRPGECATLSGPSGAGKTLFLRAIADLDPHTGTVCLDGVSCLNMSPTAWRTGVGLLTAESHWWGERVGDHFAHPALAPVDRLGFPDNVMEWRVERLSSGERQRLALIRLLENRPRVLLLDEPTANLDPDGTRKVEALLQEEQSEHNAALLWVSHDEGQIRRVAQHRYRMSAGLLEPVSGGKNP